jgi:hypothetical protein
MMIELIRNARSHTHWLTTEQMLKDLTAHRVVLQPGDKMIVTDEKPKLIPFGRRAPFRVIESHNG